MAYRSIDSLEDNPFDTFVKVTSLLKRLVENILKHPKEAKYRKLRLANETISKVILPAIGGMECLFEMGFVEGDDCLNFPANGNLSDLNKFHEALLSKMNHVTRRRAVDASSPSTTTTTTTAAAAAALAATPNISISPNSSSPLQKWLLNLEWTSNNVCQYEDKQLQLEALSCIPVHRLESAAIEQLRVIQRTAMKEMATGSGGSGELCEATAYEALLLKQLMKWFKMEFFTWVDVPACAQCHASTQPRGHTTLAPSPTAKQPTRVEVYYCGVCDREELFVRHNEARQLLAGRRGRCGEWAQCFTLMCRAMGWDARFVNDNNDHVWTEVYSVMQRRWLHCDSCECALDTPLMYEKGWKKRVDYVMAFSCDGVYDVTWRYSADHTATLGRRSLMSEATLIQHMARLTQLRRESFGERRKRYLARRHVCELVELLSAARDSPGGTYDGRSSGSIEWRLARGEITSAFVWTPTSQEMDEGKMMVRYSATRDVYLNGSGVEVVTGWRNGAFQVENIFRKEELDWKKVYLCRTEGSQTGAIIWKFQVGGSRDTETERVFDELELVFDATTFATGAVTLTCCSGDKCLTIPTNQGEGVFRTSELRGEREVTLKAVLSGGQGDMSWQHAQLFRSSIDQPQPHSPNQFPFQLTITLAPSNNTK